MVLTNIVYNVMMVPSKDENTQNTEDTQMTELMKYIPKEYKALVVDIYEEEEEFNEITNRMQTPITVEWQNGEISYFNNKSWMKKVLKEEHSPSEYAV